MDNTKATAFADALEDLVADICTEVDSAVAGADFSSLVRAITYYDRAVSKKMTAQLLDLYPVPYESSVEGHADYTACIAVAREKLGL